MQEFPTAEWYMWVDSDAMIVDPTFEIPFNEFGGKDLVAWGNEEQLRAGNALAGAPQRLHARPCAHGCHARARSRCMGSARRPCQSAPTALCSALSLQAHAGN